MNKIIKELLKKSEGKDSFTLLWNVRSSWLNNNKPFENFEDYFDKVVYAYQKYTELKKWERIQNEKS